MKTQQTLTNLEETATNKVTKTSTLNKMEKIQRVASLKRNGKSIKVVFSKQVVDRDGDTVMIDGIDYSSFMKNPVVLDSHKADSVLDILGRATNVQVTKDMNGVPMLIGDIEFADHPKAKFAEQMVRRGELNTVSIGFRVVDGGYEPSTRTITKSELFELSMVPVPANPEATVISKQAKFHELTKTIDKLEDSEEVYKQLVLYKEVHPVIKQYRKAFLSNELCEVLGYEKTGDEILDIKGVYDKIVEHLKSEDVESQEEPDQGESENQKADDEVVENQPEDEYMSIEDIKEVVNELITLYRN